MRQAKLFEFRELVAGVDEAGRGPLAGPVAAAAVILHPDRPIVGLADSKKLTAERRDVLASEIRERALAWSVAWADPAEIDALNILAATLLAMRRAKESPVSTSTRGRCSMISPACQRCSSTACCLTF